MPCPTPEQLINNFAATVFVVRRQTEGLTHADSLLVPPFRGNCLNWVLGHIVKGRNEALQRLGAEQVWSQEWIDRYTSGSDPALARANPLPLEQLLADLDETQSRLETALKGASEALLDSEIQLGEHTTTVRARLDGLHWHETLHAGSLELLRQLAGKDDQVF